jgi:2-keto-4-pentenoate hydratase/2-oxohepta-3-ene-1,7-dioic acid hydratase in catechol pathway
MIFGVAELVSYISRHWTLEPGDVIATGTPEGVAVGRPDKPWLKPGDEMVVEVGDLGRLTNRLVDATPGRP